MSVKLRLKKMGSKKRPFYRLVAADSRSPRDGRFIEALGYYNPMEDPPRIEIDDDKVFKWLDQGAKPTGNAANILKQKGLIERWQLLRQGVTVAELDAAIEQRRAKQPKAVPKKGKKLSKKAAAKAKEEAERETADAGEAEKEPSKEEPESKPDEKTAAKAGEKTDEQPAAAEEPSGETDAEAGEGDATAK